MSKETYPIFKLAERIVFNAEGTYVLLDTGCPCSFAVNGKVGSFCVSPKAEEFFDRSIKLVMPNGSKVTAILSPLDGYNCHLTHDSITITDEQEELPEHDYFLPFVEESGNFLLAMGKDLPIVEGTMNGTPIRFFFDSGARMTMFGEIALTGGKPATGSYTEWMAMLRKNETLDVYDATLDFPCGLHHEGKSALVKNREYMFHGMMMGIRAMLGIDLFNDYDLYISTANQQRGIALKRRR